MTEDQGPIDRARDFGEVRKETKEYSCYGGPGGDYEGFDEKAKMYRKTALTKAVRIVGPFRVETSEGPLNCEDGYLAKDARGYYYPIAADEFEKIYELEESKVVH